MVINTCVKTAYKEAFTNSDDNKAALKTNDRLSVARSAVKEKMRMLSEDQNKAASKYYATSQNALFGNKQSGYSDTIRERREANKATTNEIKTLKYQFKSISTKILRSKTSQQAKQAVSQAKREIIKLKREKMQGNVDSEEIDAAIAHAKAMERVARKKVRHLQEEEMAKACGGPCAGNEVDEEELEKEALKEEDEDISEEELKELAALLEESDYESIDYDFEEAQIEEVSLDDISAVDTAMLEMADMTEEMLEEVSEEMADLLEDMGLDELNDSLMAVKGDMDPADLELMKIKHRNKEMKEIVKADADYLKVIFDHLQKMKGTGAIPGFPSSGKSLAMPSFSTVAVSMSAQAFDISPSVPEGVALDISL